MNTTDGKIWYQQGISNAGLRQGQKEAKAIWSQMEGDASAAGMSVQKIWSMVGIAGSGIAAKQLIGQIVQVRGEMQMLEKSFDVLLQSEEKSAKMLSEIRALSTESPLEMTHVSQAAQTLLGFGVDAEKVMGIVRQLSDVSMGNSDRFRSLALVYAQTQAAGKLMGQDLLQMINAGFNPLQIISEQTGKSIATLKDEMSTGAISAQMVADAFAAVTSEGGKFYQMTQKQASGIVGLKASFQDAVTMMFNDLGKANEGVIADAIKGATYLVENYEKVGKILLEIAATYGVYKAALIAVNFAQAQKLVFDKLVAEQMIIERALRKGATADMIREAATTKALAIAKQGLVANLKTLAKSLVPNPYVLAAAAVAALAFGIYKLVTQQTAAEKAQERLNKRMEEFNEMEQKRRSRIDELIRIIQDETQTLYAQITAYEELEKLSPALAKAYNQEELAVLDLADANKALNAEQDKRNYDKLISDIYNARKSIVRLKEMFDLMASTPDSGFGLIRIGKQIEEQEAGLAILEQNLSDYNKRMAEAEFNALPPAEKIKIKEEQIAKIRSEFDKVNSVINEEMAKLPKEVQIPFRIEITDGQQAQGTNFIPRGFNIQQARADALRSEEHALQAEIAVIEKGNDTKKQLSEEERKRIADEASRKREAAEKASEQYQELLVQLRNNERQSEIDAMNDGLKKELEQIKLDYDLRIEEINVQEARLKKTKEEAEKGDLTDDERSQFTTQRNTALTERIRAEEAARESNAKAEADAQQDALAGFRSFEQEYMRLYEEFQTKRAEAVKAGADNEGLVLADFNFNESIKQLAADFAKNTPEFKDFANTIKQIVDGVTEDSAEAVLQNAITQLEDMLATAKAEANALMDGGIITGEGEKYKIALAEIVKLEEELESLRSKGGVKKTNDDWKKTYSTLQKVGQEFEEIGSAIGGTIGEMISLAGTIATNTVQAIDSIHTIATAAKGALSALDKASMILTAITAIGSIIGSIISGNAQKKREAAQAREAENIRRQEGLWQSINYQIERQIELLDSAAGSDYYQVAADALNQYNDALELAIKNIPKVLTDADKLAVLISEGKITGKPKETYMDALGISNEDIENAKTWYPLVINGNKKSLTALKENEEVWALIPTHIQDAIEKVIEYEDSIEDFKQRIKDDLLGTSDNIAKTLGDSLMEAFENGTNAAEAWGKAVDEIIRDIAVNAILYKTLEKQINNVIDEVTADWFDADGNLRTDIDYKKELSDFEKGLDALGPAAEALGKSIKDVFGTGTDGTASRTSAAQGLAQASQDSIDGLTGLITNIENHTYTIAEILKAGTPGFSTGNTSNTWANLEVPVINIADMMKQNQSVMQANMSALLADTSAIRSNTNRLEAMENQLMNANRRLTDINDGITQLNRR